MIVKEYNWLDELEKDLLEIEKEEKKMKPIDRKHIPYVDDMKAYCDLKDSQFVKTEDKEAVAWFFKLVDRLEDFALHNSLQVICEYDKDTYGAHLKFKSLGFDSFESKRKYDLILSELFFKCKDYHITVEDEKYVVMNFYSDLAHIEQKYDYSKELAALDKRMKDGRKIPGYM